MIGGQISVGGTYIDLRNFEDWKFAVEKFFGSDHLETIDSVVIARDPRGRPVGEFWGAGKSKQGGMVDPYSTKRVFHSHA